ncbi:uncharacterized protein LOC110466655 [Mizuhopecten yessoensis]|uniref:Uncharacterized protein n=1 Tax=Mizuhopecten yessoensis TaxID=6573 RepID=A0A210PNR6_MIZYE|nr:uncharacterized protein LOC110466655 [Mizuhopecten yessoensis]OWF38150.1 hypothetical protein KP79_PYT08823 [Mizuhopecten yessoensis]
MPENTSYGEPLPMYSMKDPATRGCVSLKDEATPRQCIECLLMKTDVKYWRRGLIEMLQGQTKGDNQYQLVTFLVSNITNAIAARKVGSKTLVRINYEETPTDLDLVNWRRVMVGLNLALEEPDTNRNIRSIGVSVEENTEVTCLQGFIEILSFLKVLSWHVVGFIVSLSKRDASTLYETLSDTSSGFSIPDCYYGSVKSLYERHMSVMRSLGFYRRSPEENVTWTLPERGSIPAAMGVIKGLCKPVSGVQESRAM